MFDLTNFTLRDVTVCGAVLRKCGAGAAGAEDVAGRVVRLLYEELREPGSGARSCALVRCFLSRPYGQLAPELQACARRRLDGAAPLAEDPCLVLLASAGDQPEWNAPHTSVRHRVLPLTGPDLAARAPMIAQMVATFGLGARVAVAPGSTPVVADAGLKGYDVVHVAEAKGSPWVPDQEEFVDRFGIRSVLGFGGLLPASQLFAVLLFARASIPRQTAELFRILGLNAKLALLPSAVSAPHVEPAARAAEALVLA